jgi:type II secretory pathway component PulC
MQKTKVIAFFSVLAFVGLTVLSFAVVQLRNAKDGLRKEIIGQQVTVRGLEESVKTLETTNRRQADRLAGPEALALRRLITEDLDEVSRSVRVVPSLSEGEGNGLKLLSIRRDSPLSVLGFRKNDIVTAFNGQDLGTIQGALEAYSAFKDAPSWTVDLLRNGEPLQLAFERPAGL